MPSRTTGHAAGEKQRGSRRLSPAALPPRRPEARERDLAGEPIAVICRERSCAQSWLYQWLYKWKNRSQVTESDGVEERSRRPQTSPTKTPEALEAEIVRRGETLSPHGSGAVSADGMREHLRQHGGDWGPSWRTISRSLKRQAQEVNARSFPSSVSDCLSSQTWEQVNRDGPSLNRHGRKDLGAARSGCPPKPPDDSGRGDAALRECRRKNMQKGA